MPLGRTTTWNVEEAASVLLGIEKTSRLLIDQLDNRLAVRKRGRRVAPDTKGVSVVCIMTCAYFCEVALKALQASLAGGTCSAGHKLAKLYDETRAAFGCADDLERAILNEVQAHAARVPSHWRPPDIRAALEYGDSNFELWRYGFMEGREHEMKSVPRQLHTVAAGVFAVVLRRHPSLWQ